MAKNINYEIKKHCGIIRKMSNSDWTKELNIVSWNEQTPKYDIREWDGTHTRMSRGITFTKTELENLFEILKLILESEE